MKKFFRIAFVLAVVLLVAGGVGWRKYRDHYPYGHSHRCSKVLAMELMGYAEQHAGDFPRSEVDGALGLTDLIKSSEVALDRIVGKAGDLEEAEKFFKKNGFIKPDHSSWHYVEGLTIEDEGRALAWDKVPLGHNGQRLDYNPREVIMVDGSVKQVNQDQWDVFLQAQEELVKHPEAAQ